MCHIVIRTKDDRKLEIEKEDYQGFQKRPLDWETVKAKFMRLSKKHIEEETAEKIARYIKDFEAGKVRDLMKLLLECKVSLENIEDNISNKQPAAPII